MNIGKFLVGVCPRIVGFTMIQSLFIYLTFSCFSVFYGSLYLITETQILVSLISFPFICYLTFLIIVLLSHFRSVDYVMRETMNKYELFFIGSKKCSYSGIVEIYIMWSLFLPFYTYLILKNLSLKGFYLFDVSLFSGFKIVLFSLFIVYIFIALFMILRKLSEIDA